LPRGWGMSTEADCPLSAMARAEIVGGAIVSVSESRSDDESVGLICDRIKGRDRVINSPESKHRVLLIAMSAEGTVAAYRTQRRVRKAQVDDVMMSVLQRQLQECSVLNRLSSL
jgi:hypothetical protein